jgi:hypothetical protein
MTTLSSSRGPTQVDGPRSWPPIPIAMSPRFSQAPWLASPSIRRPSPRRAMPNRPAWPGVLTPAALFPMPEPPVLLALPTPTLSPRAESAADSAPDARAASPIRLFWRVPAGQSSPGQERASADRPALWAAWLAIQAVRRPRAALWRESGKRAPARKAGAVGCLRSASARGPRPSR